MITDEAFRQAVKAAIAEHKKDRNIAFTWEGQTYWIKRRLSNGRNQFAKSSVNVQFYTEIARSIQTHYLNIINFFERRATNAAAESFNAKIKAFRAQFRGVRDKAFFLYRLAKLYA